MHPREARQHLIRTYQETGSIRATARLRHTSPQVVQKRLRRFQSNPEKGLEDHSRRPQHSPQQTPAAVEERMVAARQATGYEPQRLAFYLQRQGLLLSPHTIRHILRRHDLVRPHHPPRTFYPAHWAWEVEEPFTLFQTDVKDILDKDALGTERWHHLPRYQWTACEARTRLRLLAYSHHLNRDNGLAFLPLVLLWLRAYDVSTPIAFQTDGGQEFGGNNPEQIATPEKRPLSPSVTPSNATPQAARSTTAAWNAAIAATMRSSITLISSPCPRKEHSSTWRRVGFTSTTSCAPLWEQAWRGILL